MIKSTMFYLLLLLSSTVTAQSIDTVAKIQQLKELGKDSLVKLAEREILSTVDMVGGISDDFVFAPYEVTIWLNDEMLVVKFELPIVRLVPLNTCYFGDLVVDLVSNRVSLDQMQNSEDCDEVGFMMRSPTSEKQINFIRKSVNDSQEIGTFSEQKYADKKVIHEYEKYYKVTVKSVSQNLYYKVEKGTGRIYEILHRRNAPIVKQDLTNIFN
ncbi:MAG: hypothetical protein OCD76_10345 [Reichenbachiella sp.]